MPLPPIMLIGHDLARSGAGPARDPGPGSAPVGGLVGQVAEETEEDRPIRRIEPPERLLGALPPGDLQPVEEEPTVGRQRDECRATVLRIGMARNQPGGLDPVDEVGDRPRHDREPLGDGRHPQRPVGEEADDPRLRPREAERCERLARTAMELADDPAQQVGDLDRGLDLGRGGYDGAARP